MASSQRIRTLHDAVALLKRDLPPNQFRDLEAMLKRAAWELAHPGAFVRRQNAQFSDRVDFSSVRAFFFRKGVRFGWSYTFKRFLDGGWVPTQCFHNIVTDAGVTHALDVELSNATQSATWYVGLIDGAGTPSVLATHTMAAHAEWTENQNYDEAVRQTFTASTAAAKSLDNNGNEAVFSIQASQTLEGAFLVDDNTKGGATGTLYSAAIAGAEEVFGAAGSLSVELTFTGDDDGV